MPDVMIGLVGSESCSKHAEMFAAVLEGLASTVDCEKAVDHLCDWASSLHGQPYTVVIAALSRAIAANLGWLAEDMDDDERAIVAAGTLLFVSALIKRYLAPDDAPDKDAN